MPGTTHRRPPSALVYYTLIVSLAHGSAGPHSLRSHRPRAAALVIRSRPAAALAVLAPCARSVAADAAAQHQHLLFPRSGSAAPSSGQRHLAWSSGRRCSAARRRRRRCASFISFPPWSLPSFIWRLEMKGHGHRHGEVNAGAPIPAWCFCTENIAWRSGSRARRLSAFVQRCFGGRRLV